MSALPVVTSQASTPPMSTPGVPPNWPVLWIPQAFPKSGSFGISAACMGAAPPPCRALNCMSGSAQATRGSSASRFASASTANPSRARLSMR